MFDLNTVVVNSISGFTLTDATGINNIGQIVAIGLNSASQEEAFLLTPVPEHRSGDGSVDGPCRLALSSQPFALVSDGAGKYLYAAGNGVGD